MKDDHITLERNPNYWKKDASGTQLPYLDKVTIRPIVDETVALTNVKTGDIDIGYVVPAKDYASVKAGKDLVLQETPGLGYASIVLNVQAEPFNKKEFRQAFAEALDRDQIMKTVFFGVGKSAFGPIAPPSWAFDDTYKPYTGDVAKAKQYLTAGGKPDGFTCEMKITAGSPTTTQLAQLMKDQVAKAGIIMNLVQLDFPTLVADTQARKYQANLVGWSGRIDPDGNIYNMLHTGAAGNDSQYSNPQADDLMDKARAADRSGAAQGAVSAVAEDRRGRCAADLLPLPHLVHALPAQRAGDDAHRRSDHALRDGLAEIAGSGQRAAGSGGRAHRVPPLTTDYWLLTTGYCI